uniref:Uncharacterized protein n=1 Tax=Oryza punctata TaxID=4537 RepID=A0A0E0LVI4_ORYPU
MQSPAFAAISFISCIYLASTRKATICSVSLHWLAQESRYLVMLAGVPRFFIVKWGSILSFISLNSEQSLVIFLPSLHT